LGSGVNPTATTTTTTTTAPPAAAAATATTTQWAGLGVGSARLAVDTAGDLLGLTRAAAAVVVKVVGSSLSYLLRYLTGCDGLFLILLVVVEVAAAAVVVIVVGRSLSYPLRYLIGCDEPPETALGNAGGHWQGNNDAEAGCGECDLEGVPLLKGNRSGKKNSCKYSK